MIKKYFSFTHCNSQFKLNLQIKVKLSDGWAYLLPGDSFYPKEPENNEVILDKFDMTLEQFRSVSEVLHREEINGSTNIKSLTCNLKSRNGHLLPLSAAQKKKLLIDDVK